MKRALLLVEGHTEERFVKDVLQEHFWKLGLDLAPTLIVTKKVTGGPRFKGGVTTYRQFENDVRRLFAGAGDALVTTMLDYDGLPSDFPGMSTRPARGCLERVTHVEEAIRTHFGRRRGFLPYLSMHEFESLLFSSPDELPRVMANPDSSEILAAVRQAHASPEEINETDWPSRRLMKLFAGYRKALHGPITAKRIGLSTLRGECPHFDTWLKSMESFARDSSSWHADST